MKKEIDVSAVLGYVYGQKRRDAKPQEVQEKEVDSKELILLEARKIVLRNTIAEIVVKIENAQEKLGDQVYEMLVTELSSIYERVQDKSAIITITEARKLFDRIDEALLIFRDATKY